MIKKKKVLTFHALIQTRTYIMDLLLFSVSVNLRISISGVIFTYNCICSPIKAQKSRKENDDIGCIFKGQ